MVTNNAANEPTAASGKVLQGQGVGTTSAFSTATYPSTAGTSGNVLTSNGTNFVSSPLSGNPVLILSQTASSSSSIAWTSGITGYTYYQIVFYGVVLSTNNVQILLTVSTNGGSSYSSSGYYVSGYQISSNLSQAFGSFAQNNVSSWLIGNGVSNSSTGSCNAIISMYNLNSSSVNKNIVFSFVGQYQGATESVTDTASGMWATTTAVNAVKLAPSSGTFSSGTFNLYGIV